MTTTYKYEIYDPTGVYIGIVEPDSIFNYNQIIATSFAQITVVVPISADIASQASTPILDETGATILDETGAAIYDEGAPNIIGDNTIFCEQNLIIVYEYSTYHPNGVTVFSGYVSKIKPNYGVTNDVTLTCISNGQDLAQHNVRATPVLDKSQTLFDQTQTINGASGAFVFGITPASATAISNLYLKLATITSGTLPVTVSIYSSYGGALFNLSAALSGSVPDATATLAVNSTSATNYNASLVATFPAFMGTFYVRIVCADATGVKLYGTSSGPMIPYYLDYNRSTAISAAFTSTELGSIASTIIANYNTEGGLVTVPLAGYASTGIVTSYTFKIQTVLQALQVIAQLLPANWYWYVDPGTNILQLAQSNTTTADFQLIKGYHIVDFEPEQSKENIVNVANFSGGDDGSGTNTFIFVQVTSSNGNRASLVNLSDNRVNAANLGSKANAVTVAKQFAQNYLNVNASRSYIGSVTIAAGTIDFTTIKLGMMCGFAGFGNYVDKLLLQVVGINYSPDQLQLQLGTLPMRDSQTITSLQVQLTAQQTIDNPSTSS